MCKLKPKLHSGEVLSEKKKGGGTFTNNLNFIWKCKRPTIVQTNYFYRSMKTKTT